MKRLIHTVRLKFFCDDEIGWGVSHQETAANGFNAFWTGDGFFHDVFEHWFEDRIRYFRGEYAFNIGGEMAAMGASMYFTDEIGVRREQYRHYSETIREVTESELIGAIREGHCGFGQELLCGVPYQRDTYNCFLEEIPDKMMESISDITIDEGKYTTDYEREFSDGFKKSVTKAKIRNLHRYGYRLARRRFGGEDYENRDVLNGFVRFWNMFCELRDPEELALDYDAITVRVYKDLGVLSWTATFEPVPGHRPIIREPRISSNNLIKHVEKKAA